MARGQRSEEQAAALEQLRTENEALAAELEQLRAECVRLSGEVQTLEASLQEQRRNSDLDVEKDEELERLRTENSELAAQSSQSVLLTVELTTLRNQVRRHALLRRWKWRSKLQIWQAHAELRSLTCLPSAGLQAADSLHCTTTTAAPEYSASLKQDVLC